MSSFTTLTLPKTLDTSTADIIEDFFIPVLAQAVRYDRGRVVRGGCGLQCEGWGNLQLTAGGDAGSQVPF